MCILNIVATNGPGHYKFHNADEMLTAFNQFYARILQYKEQHQKIISQFEEKTLIFESMKQLKNMW